MIQKRKLFTITLFLISLHSTLLGIFIFIMPNFFHNLFFSAQAENIFFVRQAGLFLFLLGIFYGFPLINLDKFSKITGVTIFTKICAVLFLFTNAGLTPSPLIIYLTGFVDGCMATALLTTYVMFQRENIPPAVPERGDV